MTFFLSTMCIIAFVSFNEGEERASFLLIDDADELGLILRGWCV